MTREEIIQKYESEIEKSDSTMEKNLLVAEMNHKLKLLSVDLTDEDIKRMRDESDYECEGCGS